MINIQYSGGYYALRGADKSKGNFFISNEEIYKVISTIENSEPLNNVKVSIRDGTTYIDGLPIDTNKDDVLSTLVMIRDFLPELKQRAKDKALKSQLRLM